MTPEEIAAKAIRPDSVIGNQLRFYLDPSVIKELEQVIASAIRDDRRRQELEKDPIRDR